jgi:glycosyltransferase involved in cell wall biosynthesis
VPRILIDISRLFYWKLIGRLYTGIDRVGQEYVRHYGDAQRYGARAVLTLGPFSTVLSEADSARAFRVVLAPELPGKVEMAWLIVKAYFSWWLPADVEGCVLFNTSHTRLDDPGYAKSLARRGARLVFVVHDLIPITHPEYFRDGEFEIHARRVRNALARGHGVVVVSQGTREALERFARDEDVPMPPVIVAPLASALRAAEPGLRPVAAPYFVILGTIEPRKNHLLLLHLWRDLVTSHKSQAASHKGRDDAVPQLVVIGQRGWECENIVDLLERCEPLDDTVIELNSCSDAELATWLRHACALLFPSFIEGYGLPLAEALAVGTPAIVSDLPVFREVAGDIPEYADPLDGRRWAELILDYAGENSARRAAQIERMKSFRASTWPQHFEIVDAFVAKLV